MRYSNRDLAKAFARGETVGVNNNGTMYISHDTIFSYGSHWPMAHRNGRVVYVNSDRFSPTTSKQTGYVAGACAIAGLEIVKMPKTDLLAFIDKQNRS